METFVDEGEGAENFDGDDVAAFGDAVADLADVDGVVVALAAGALVDDVGVLPGLRDGAVVPDVAVVREAVGHEAQLALLHVLLDRVQRLLLANLRRRPVGNSLLTLPLIDCLFSQLKGPERPPVVPNYDID